MSTNCQSNEIMLNIVQYRPNDSQSANHWLSRLCVIFNFIGLFNEEKINSRIVSSSRTPTRVAEFMRPSILCTSRADCQERGHPVLLNWGTDVADAFCLVPNPRNVAVMQNPDSIVFSSPECGRRRRTV